MIEDPYPEPEPVDDLMLRDDEFYPHVEGRRLSSSVREMASRIPDSLSAIGRDISRTIEKAISAKDDFVIGVRTSPEVRESLHQLVQAGVFRNRAEAAAYMIEEGLKTQSVLLERVRQKLSEIERLQAELRGMVKEDSSRASEGPDSH